MTPLTALAHKRQGVHTLEHMLLCEGCKAALLREMRLMFSLIPEDDEEVLGSAQIMGYTFTQGTPEQCGLHVALRENV